MDAVETLKPVAPQTFWVLGFASITEMGVRVDAANSTEATGKCLAVDTRRGGVLRCYAAFTILAFQTLMHRSDLVPGSALRLSLWWHPLLQWCREWISLWRRLLTKCIEVIEQRKCATVRIFICVWPNIVRHVELLISHMARR